MGPLGDAGLAADVPLWPCRNMQGAVGQCDLRHRRHAKLRVNPTPLDTINSPLEQFNILSVYDASLVYTSICEITYVKILPMFRYTFYNLPETISLNYQLLSGAVLSPMPGLLSNTPAVAAPPAEPFFFASLIESLILVIADPLTNSAHDSYHPCLSLARYISYTDPGLFYSADHIYITKILGSLGKSDAVASSTGHAPESTSVRLD